MKVNEVPQDKSDPSMANWKELCYAVDENGNYTTKQSRGWEPKGIALNKSLELIDERVKEIKEKVINKELSPIVYYMELNRMDLTVLADYMGKWKWLIKRHFKPDVFKNLSAKTIDKYANTFNISVEQLKDINL